MKDFLRQQMGKPFMRRALNGSSLPNNYPKFKICTIFFLEWAEFQNFG